MADNKNTLAQVAVKTAQVLGGAAVIANNLISPSPGLPDRCLPGEPTPAERTYDAAAAAYEDMKREESNGSSK